MDGWVKVSEYGLSHPTGWTIAKCIVNGTPVYVLWKGNDFHGKFDDADAAKAKHVQEVGAVQMKLPASSHGLIATIRPSQRATTATAR